VEIRDPSELERLCDDSRRAPVVLFKHSPVCGTSAQAYDELEDLLHGGAPADVHLVNVLTSRPLSQLIAQRFGIRHESPQLLILRNGQVQWHGSHYRVTADPVRRALESLR
jgi:bacillithiol system protein YtxJ